MILPTILIKALDVFTESVIFGAMYFVRCWLQNGHIRMFEFVQLAKDISKLGLGLLYRECGSK
jgi:hypothetical protein